MVNRIRKTITGSENVVYDVFGNNTVAFLADLPKNAIVINVIVTGEKNGEKFVRNLVVPHELAEDVRVSFYHNTEYCGKTVAAVLHSVYDGNEIVDAAKMLAIEEFTVEYIAAAIVEE